MARIAVAGGEPVLDPVENISTGGVTTVGDGRHRRAYLAASTSGGWGEYGHTCGAQTLVKRTADYVQIAPVLCDRWSCTLCGPRRVAWLKRQIAQAVEQYELRYFWTLTVWTETCTPAESFTLIQQSWNRLRKTLTKHHGAFSYVWTVEATKQGYAHLHLLTTLKVSRGELARRWRQASRGSFIVDVQPIHSTKAANYLAKYCVQQATLRQDPAWSELAGKRMFSKSRDVQFEPFRPPQEDSEGGWEIVDIPYWEMAARLRKAAPVRCERVRGVPLLVVEAHHPRSDPQGRTPRAPPASGGAAP